MPKLTHLILAGCCALTLCTTVHSQEEKLRIDENTVRVIESPWKFASVDTDASFRGLHVYSKRDVWASGSKGTIVNTNDGGETWRVMTVPGAEELDFRDIHAIDEGTVVAMTSGTPARIYRSTTAGSSWKLCYENKDEKVFLDALSFLDDRRGVVMGDPIGDGLFLLATRDGGNTWKPFKKVPRVKPGEAGFAASGTNMTTVGSKRVYIGLGSHLDGQVSQTSRVIFSVDSARSWKQTSLPIARGKSAGIFSICFADEKYGVAVGGDYEKPDDDSSNYATTRDGGRTWTTPSAKEPPSGFRSCVSLWRRYNREINMIAVGTNGTDRSTDLGNKWRRVSNEGFNAVDFGPDGRVGWAVGADGRIAKWQGVSNVAIKPTTDTVKQRP